MNKNADDSVKQSQNVINENTSYKGMLNLSKFYSASIPKFKVKYAIGGSNQKSIRDENKKTKKWKLEKRLLKTLKSENDSVILFILIIY